MKKSSDLERTWDETKQILKQKFAMLTDSDLLFIEGKHDEVLNKIREKLGKSKEEIQKIISEL